MVRSRFSKVRLVESTENRGFAWANNLAIRQSKGDKVLLLNPDTEILAGAIERLSDFLNRNPGAAAVGPMLLDSRGSVHTSPEPAPTLLGELARLFHLDILIPFARYPIDKWDINSDHKVEVLQGACLMLRREPLDQIGLLDEGYFMYSEEVDLCHRLLKAGWGIYWLPQAKVVHHGGQSSSQAPMESFIQLYKGKVTYFRKHHGVAAAFAYKLILAAASLARLLLTPLSVLERRTQRERHLGLAQRYGRLLTTLPTL
jgi:GT2 family glycosyltransferase